MILINLFTVGVKSYYVKLIKAKNNRQGMQGCQECLP